MREYTKLETLILCRSGSFLSYCLPDVTGHIVEISSTQDSTIVITSATRLHDPLYVYNTHKVTRSTINNWLVYNKLLDFLENRVD